jgi:hypothetical protein
MYNFGVKRLIKFTSRLRSPCQCPCLRQDRRAHITQASLSGCHTPCTKWCASQTPLACPTRGTQECRGESAPPPREEPREPSVLAGEWRSPDPLQRTPPQLRAPPETATQTRTRTRQRPAAAVSDQSWFEGPQLLHNHCYFSRTARSGWCSCRRKASAWSARRRVARE